MVDLAEEKDAPGMGLEEKNASEEKDAPVKEKIPDEKDLPAEKDVQEKEGVASKVCRDAESPCMGQENYDICISLLGRGCPENKIVYMEMCPVSVSCMVDLAEEKDAPVMESEEKNASEEKDAPEEKKEPAEKDIPDEKDLPKNEGV